MDDFTLHGDSFDECLHHLTLVLRRWIETNLVLNFEKCHFMVEHGVALGHVVSSRGELKLISSSLYPIPSVSKMCGHS